jgi:hypothetical protein
VNTSALDRPGITHEWVDAYTEHGCNITAPEGSSVLVIRYQQAWENHPRHGQFNSGSILDALDWAKQYAAELLGGGRQWSVALGIPDLVIIAANDDESIIQGES